MLKKMLPIFLVLIFSSFAATWIQSTDSDFSLGEFTSTEVNGTRTDAKVQLTAATSTEYGSKLLVEGTNSFNLSNNAYVYSLRFTATSSITVTNVHLILFKTGTIPDYALEVVANNTGDLPTGTSLTTVTITDATPGISGTVAWKSLALPSGVLLSAGSVYHIKVSLLSGTADGSNYLRVYGTTPQIGIVHTYSVSSTPVTTKNTYTDGYLSQVQYTTSWSDRHLQPTFLLEGSDVSVPTTYTMMGSPYYTYSQSLQIYSNRFFGAKIFNTNRTIKEVSFRVRSISLAPPPADHLYVTLANVTDAVDIETVKLVDRTNISTIFAWYTVSFSSPHTLDASKVYRLYLKSPGSTNTGYYIPHRVQGLTPGYTEQNNLTFDGTDVVYTENTGASWVENVDSYDIIFSTKDSTYATTGIYSSSVFDAGASALFNTISFLPADQSAGTSIKLQVASCNSDSGPWNFHGPDATTTTYYTISSGENINSEHSAKRFLRYKAYLDSSSALVTPYLESVSVSYALRQMPGTELQTVCYPSPFAPSKGSLTSTYILNKDSNVTVKIYSLIGGLVRSYTYAAGSEGGKGVAGGYNNKIEWDGRNGDGMTVGNGVYIIRINAEPSDGSEAVVETKKVMVVK